jgi:rhodanese-related sulfurtransferase
LGLSKSILSTLVDSVKSIMNGPSISVTDLKKLLEKGTPVKMVDVRTGFEYKSGHIPGTVHLPAPALSHAAVNFEPEVPVVLICAVGHRAKVCQNLIANSGLSTLVLEGGTGAWQAEGLPIVNAPRQRISPMRQAFFFSSLMIFGGLYLGLTQSQTWFLLAGMPGVGLLVTAIAGFCPMEWILSKAPWNK